MVEGSRKRTALSILFSLLIVALIAGCSGGGDKAGGDSKGTLKLADLQWQTMWINNAIAGYILEKGYGYETEIVEMTTPIMNRAVVNGEVDIVMETWTSNIIDWFEGAKAKNEILVLGRTIDKGEVGWYVPRYVIEGDAARGIKASAPDLKSVTQLKDYKHLFPDPEDKSKGVLISCITGWNCAVQNRIKIYAYGLGDHYNLQEPGAGAALDAAIASAYKRGEPVLTYYWGPTWLLGTYDMVMLEEPAWNQECEDIQQKIIAGDMRAEEAPPEAGCGYRPDEILISVHPSLKERAPEVVEFLDKYEFTAAETSAISAYMQNEEKSAEQTAIWFLKNNTDKWHAMVPADVAAKVDAALKEEG